LSGGAYGQRNPELVQKISRATLDQNSEADASYVPGDLVDFPTPDGKRFAGVLKEITDSYALFDFNHPLAGKSVVFEVQILGVL
jgi:FKBP-type peptidyl-prolyl cis-trans isomerase SlpA